MGNWAWMCSENLAILAQTDHEIYSREFVGGFVFGHYSSVDNFRPAVYNDVISSVIVDTTGMKVFVKCGDSRSNHY